MLDNGLGSSPIPFNVPYVNPEADHLLRTFLKQSHFCGDGPATEFAVKLLGEVAQADRLLLTPSCSYALELAMQVLDVGPGDEVIMPSFNFPSAANAVLLTGATPVFVDVDISSMCMTAADVEPAISRRTRAIVALPYGGFGSYLLELKELSKRQHIHLIEDAAHGLGIHTTAGPIGSFGVMATYSFHETKNIQSGEGGALQVNDPALWERAQVLREKGTNRKAFRDGLVDKYTWQLAGGSGLMNDLTATLLASNIRNYTQVQKDRTETVDTYRAELRALVEDREWFMTPLPVGQDEPAHLFGLVLSSESERRSFIAHLKDLGINAAFHYQPLHESERGTILPHVGACKNSAELGRRLVRLPLFVGMSPDQTARVVAAIDAFRK